MNMLKDLSLRDRKYLIAAACVVVGFVFIGYFLGFFSSKGYPLIPHIALLYVGTDTSEGVIALEREIHDTVTKLRAQERIFPNDLTVVSYHFNRPGEREVCESKFSISDADLPFLGVVELDAKDIPTQVLYRQKVESGDREHLQTIFREAVKMLKEGIPIGH